MFFYIYNDYGILCRTFSLTLTSPLRYFEAVIFIIAIMSMEFSCIHRNGLKNYIYLWKIRLLKMNYWWRGLLSSTNMWSLRMTLACLSSGWWYMMRHWWLAMTRYRGWSRPIGRCWMWKRNFCKSGAGWRHGPLELALYKYAPWKSLSHNTWHVLFRECQYPRTFGTEVKMCITIRQDILVLSDQIAKMVTNGQQ